jgi:GrpB-like predicted nucleotidyltransferase (UPF0157 family)
MSPKKNAVELVPYRPEWIKMYQDEAEKLEHIFGDHLIELHHIGSTSIPGIFAKPVIDVMAIVKDIELIDGLNDQFILSGYRPRGELEIAGRRYFGKSDFHVHTYQIGNENIEKQLLFRDYLLKHPKEAQRYSELKKELAIKYPEQRKIYTEAKAPFVQEILNKSKAELIDE